MWLRWYLYQEIAETHWDGEKELTLWVLHLRLRTPAFWAAPSWRGTHSNPAEHWFWVIDNA